MKKRMIAGTLVIGIAIGAIGHAVLLPTPAQGERGAQNVLMDFNQHKETYGITGYAALPIIGCEIEATDEVVFIVQNGKVYRSTENGEPGSWQLCLE